MTSPIKLENIVVARPPDAAIASGSAGESPDSHPLGNAAAGPRPLAWGHSSSGEKVRAWKN